MKSRFKTLEDFYKAVDALIERATLEHHDDDARRLYALLHEMAWTTSSELLGELTAALKEMKKKMKGTYSPETRMEIKECLQFTIHHRRILGLK
jgi:prephenate dehydrogenase